MAEVLLASRCCNQCLTTRNRIVPGERAAQIISDCRRDDSHFICHKGSIAELEVRCRGVHDILGGDKAFRLAQWLKLPIREVDPETLDG